MKQSQTLDKHKYQQAFEESTIFNF